MRFGRTRPPSTGLLTVAFFVASYIAVPLLTGTIAPPLGAPTVFHHAYAGSLSMSTDPVLALPVDQAVYDSAMAVFVRSGLVPPVFRAVFHLAPQGCDGHLGRHIETATGFSIAHVCVNYARPSLQERARRNTLLHEVAHAWIAQNVSQERRSAFMDLRGLDIWNGREAPWEERAAEHAAEILIWGMTSGEEHIDVRLGQTDAATLAPAYEILVATAHTDPAC